jgi:hypothetical protein
MSKNKELKAEEFFLEGYACSQTVLMAFADEIGRDLKFEDIFVLSGLKSKNLVTHI